MSSNFPPGVSGSEYAIAGPDYEEDEERTCGAPNVTVHTISDAGLTDLRQATAAPLRLQTALAGIEDVDFDSCPFTGEVTVQGVGNTLWWTCPLCHTEHSEDLEPEGDGE